MTDQGITYPCRDCGHPVSGMAYVCPSCGRQLKIDPTRIAAWIIIAAAVLGVTSPIWSYLLPFGRWPP